MRSFGLLNEVRPDQLCSTTFLRTSKLIEALRTSGRPLGSVDTDSRGARQVVNIDGWVNLLNRFEAGPLQRSVARVFSRAVRWWVFFWLEDGVVWRGSFFSLLAAREFGKAFWWGFTSSGGLPAVEFG